MNYYRMLIAQYPNWGVFLSEKQYYLGRTYLWLKRPGDMQRLTDLTQEELLEMQAVLNKVQIATDALFAPDHYNYAWLGNEFHSHGGHGHLHVIPRYKGVRQFLGVSFKDDRWGKNYQPSLDLRLSDERLMKLVESMQGQFNKLEPI